MKMHKTLLFKNCKISYNTKETFENIEVELLTCKIGYNTKEKIRKNIEVELYTCQIN